MPIIEVTNLVKEYQRKTYDPGLKGMIKSFIKPEYSSYKAVDQINFSIEKGEAVGYVGPNGSGKSTTIKMLSGILTPTNGTVIVNGLIPTQNRIKNNKKIGVVFGNRSQLWWDVPVIESFRLIQKTYEVPEHIFEENLNEFKEIMGLEEFLKVPERQLSLGQKMRCNITAAFLHNPDVVYLDEPTIGLDAESKSKIREFIKKINQTKKTTFIVTSHDFQDIESLCSRIILINHGKLVIDAGIETVRKNFNKTKKIRIEIKPDNTATLPQLFGSKISKDGDYYLNIEYDVNKTDAIQLIDQISKYFEIIDISISGRDIESIIQEIIREDNHIDN